MSDETYLRVMIVGCALVALAFWVVQRRMARRDPDADPFGYLAAIIFAVLAALHTIPWWPGGWA